MIFLIPTWITERNQKYFYPCEYLFVQQQPGSAHASYRYPYPQFEPDLRCLKYFDGGFFLSIPTTGSTFWRLVYRFDGKSTLLSFGEYSAVSLKDARERREDAK